MSKDNTLSNMVADNVRRLREKKNWTKSHLAELSKVDASHLSNIENGKKSMGLDLLGRIAEAFDIEPYRLLQSHQLEEFAMQRKIEEIQSLPEIKRIAIEQMINAFLRESQMD